MISDTLVIIPARGGSKGIPGKNIRPLGGKPLLLYTVDLARELFPDSHIILSTDSEEIALTARTAGLPVPYMRPPELATDSAPTRDALLHVMDWADAIVIGPGLGLSAPPTTSRAVSASTPPTSTWSPPSNPPPPILITTATRPTPTVSSTFPRETDA